MLRSTGVRVARRLSSQLIQKHVRVGQMVAWQQQQFRFVNSRKGGKFVEGDILEEDEVPPELHPKEKIVTADDLEFYDSMAYDEDYDSGEDNEEKEEELAREQERQKIRDELDARTGRLWTDPWEITEEDWSKFRTSDDLPDWTPDLCSRVSLERIQIYSDGIATLADLARIPLPPPPPPHPGREGQARVYARHRKRHQYKYIAQQVQKEAEPKINAIMKLGTWEEKQNAVDELFETVEFRLKEQEQILSKHPKFGEWVERALEEYLRSVKPQEEGESESEESSKEQVESESFPTAEQDEEALPMFVDMYDKSDGEGATVPKILHPLKPHPHDGPGRMVEEWELSAHKKTKRILLRQCTRQVAQLLDNDSNPVRVYVTGPRGVGKTATLATIVASARQSGSIVLYLPDGDRLRKNGFYVEPSVRREGMFDLPILSKEVCTELLTSHESDLEGMSADSATLSQFFDHRDLKKLESPESISLVELLQQGRDHSALAPMCYSAVVHTLMNQTEKDFVIVADEFNCYYDYGHYFHVEYDENVHRAIPCDKINLFEPVLGAMGLSTAEEEDDATTPAFMMKRGGIVVGTTESHAVAGKFTNALEASAKRAAAANDENAPLHVVEVPRFSALEVEHIIANFEATGIGRLRFDRGETVMNDQEVAYINMVAGGIGQNLIDECVV